jgi:hypothetical protein
VAVTFPRSECVIFVYSESWYRKFTENPTHFGSMEWHHTSPYENARNVPTACKVVWTVFLYAKGCILFAFLLKGETINAACYVNMLKELWFALCEKRLMQKTASFNTTQHNQHCMSDIGHSHWKWLGSTNRIHQNNVTCYGHGAFLQGQMLQFSVSPQYTTDVKWYFLRCSYIRNSGTNKLLLSLDFIL